MSWKDKISNEVVHEMVNETKCLIRTISERKKNWIGHSLRGNRLLKDVIEGRMNGKRGRSRPRIGMLNELMEGSFEKRREELW
ncbi:MAG: hypothetical protein ACHQ1D_09550 [Nitrososphaerales archaeon]